MTARGCLGPPVSWSHSVPGWVGSSTVLLSPSEASRPARAGAVHLALHVPLRGGPGLAGRWRQRNLILGGESPVPQRTKSESPSEAELGAGEPRSGTQSLSEWRCPAGCSPRELVPPGAWTSDLQELCTPQREHGDKSAPRVPGSHTPVARCRPRQREDLCPGPVMGNQLLRLTGGSPLGRVQDQPHRCHLLLPGGIQGQFTGANEQGTGSPLRPGDSSVQRTCSRAPHMSMSPGGEPVPPGFSSETQGSPLPSLSSTKHGQPFCFSRMVPTPPAPASWCRAC